MPHVCKALFLTTHWFVGKDAKSYEGQYDTNVAVGITGGSFLMGCGDESCIHSDAEGPVRQVTVHSFSIDAEAVSNM